MNRALARAASPENSPADAIEGHCDTLAGRSGKQDLLAEIAPGLGTKEAAGRSPRDRRRLAALEAM